jgi:AAA ATPase domain
VVSRGEHLVGPAESLGAFADALSEFDTGRSAALALVGEPGISKTRLLGELAARADAPGVVVLYESASEPERDLPFRVFFDALDACTPAEPGSVTGRSSCSWTSSASPSGRRVRATMHNRLSGDAG